MQELRREAVLLHRGDGVRLVVHEVVVGPRGHVGEEGERRLAVRALAVDEGGSPVAEIDFPVVDRALHHAHVEIRVGAEQVEPPPAAQRDGHAPPAEPGNGAAPPAALRRHHLLFRGRRGDAVLPDEVLHELKPGDGFGAVDEDLRSVGTVHPPAPLEDELVPVVVPIHHKSEPLHLAARAPLCQAL